jgi:hypothetical protein
MSYQTNKSFTFYHHGKVVEIYRVTTDIDGEIATLDGYKMVIPSSSSTTGISYPDETITNGIRVEYTALVKPFVQQDPESTAYSSLTEVTSPNELTHLNLNRVLSLAIVDYLKAMMAERDGDLQQKEYYMRNFHKKVSDNESNKNKIHIAQSSSYSVK